MAGEIDNRPNLYGNNLFGDPVLPDSRGKVADDFVMAPFTLLNAREGFWQDRKRAWIRIGIKSQEGRDARCLPVNSQMEKFGKAMKADGQSIFDPVLTEIHYDWFCPRGGQIIDPFAGGSVRGVVAGSLGYRYWGCDLSQEQIDANRLQSCEIFGHYPFERDDLTPVQKVGERWVKRDDLFSVGGASGGKARTCWALATGGNGRGLTTAGSRQSPQAMLVAAMASMLNMPCAIHCPEGDISSGPVHEAKLLGAEIIQHKAGYNTVIIARAREYAEQHGYTLIPFGMEHEEAVTQTRKQVANIPKDVKRIVIPVGSAMSLAGLLWGLLDRNLSIPVLGVVVGADPLARLNQYAPPFWEQMVTLVKSERDYHDHVVASVCGVGLDPIYEAKCAKYCKAGDLLWIVGHRDRIIKAGETPPVWRAGDSAKVDPEDIPSADFLFTCPPYGDLEVYSDDAADISNMEHDKFLSVYRDIVRAWCNRLKRDRFAAVVVGDFRDKKTGNYRNFVSDTIQAFLDAGLHLYNESILITAVGSLPVRITRQFNAGRKLGKTHQNILVFVKGDGKAATEAINKTLVSL